MKFNLRCFLIIIVAAAAFTAIFATMIKVVKADALICNTISGGTTTITEYKTTESSEGLDAIVRVSSFDEYFFRITYRDNRYLYLDRTITSCHIIRTNGATPEREQHTIDRARETLNITTLPVGGIK